MLRAMPGLICSLLLTHVAAPCDAEARKADDVGLQDAFQPPPTDQDGHHALWKTMC
jgi:hypothetical protein